MFNPAQGLGAKIMNDKEEASYRRENPPSSAKLKARFAPTTPAPTLNKGKLEMALTPTDSVSGDGIQGNDCMLDRGVTPTVSGWLNALDKHCLSMLLCYPSQQPDEDYPVQYCPNRWPASWPVHVLFSAPCLGISTNSGNGNRRSLRKNYINKRWLIFV